MRKYQVTIIETVTYQWEFDLGDDEDPEEAARQDHGGNGRLDAHYQDTVEVAFEVRDLDTVRAR